MMVAAPRKNGITRLLRFVVGWSLRRLRIEADEQRLFLWAVSGLFLLGFADVAVQNAAETFFLKRVGVEYLPLAFLASTFLLIGTTHGLARLVTRADRSALLPKAYALIAICLLPLWFLVHWDVEGGFILLLFASGQIKVVALLVFWVVMGDLLHARQAKRLFAPLMGGVTLGTIAGSFSSDFVGLWLGIDGVVYFSALVIGAAALSALPLGAKSRVRLDTPFREPSESPTHFSAIGFEVRAEETPASMTFVWRESVLFRALLVITVCSAAVAPMLYFQISFIADQATRGTGGEQELLALYAQLRGWMNVAVLLFQVFVTSSLYQRIGVPLAALFSPGVYLLSFLGLSIRLSLPVGIAAFTAVKLQEKSVQGPAIRILYSLFPDDMRSRATALLEGPIRGAGGVIGNLLTLAGLAVGTAAWAGYVAIPITLLWFSVSVYLWRTYPQLLIDALVGRDKHGEDDELQGLLDPGTLRVMDGYLTSVDPDTRRVAADLLSDLHREVAVGVLAETAAATSGEIRSELIDRLDRLIEGQEASLPHNAVAAAAIKKLFEHPDVPAGDRAVLIRVYGTLADDAKSTELDRYLNHPVAAIRLAAAGVLRSRGAALVSDDELNGMLAEALRGDALCRNVACRELRTLLVTGAPDRIWQTRLDLLLEQLVSIPDMPAAAEALADVAQRHGAHLGAAVPVMLGLKNASDARVRAAVMRFVGYMGLGEHASWLVEGLESRNDDEGAAARAGLSALGTQAARSLITAHNFLRRSTRERVLGLVREIALEEETLELLYQREIQGLRTTYANFCALNGDGRPQATAGIPGNEASQLVLLRQRLVERLHESVHAALFLLALIHREQQIAELDELLRQTWNRRERALLIEALELFISPQEKDELTPFLETRDFESMPDSSAYLRHMVFPSAASAAQALLADADPLTQALAQTAFPESSGAGAAQTDGLVRRQLIERVMYLREVPLFQHLTVRQLVDLVKVVEDEVYRGREIVLSEGEAGSTMYVIVAGEVEVRKRERVLTRLGPGGFFGEMAVLEGEVRSATIVAVRETRLIRINGDDLVSLMFDLPAIAIAISRELAHRVEALSQRVSGFAPDAPDESADAHPEGAPSRKAGTRLGRMELALHLKSIGLFSGLENTVLMRLAHVVQEEYFPPGAVIVREDDYASCIYLVVDGATRIVKGSTLLAEFGAHTFFGELALLGDGTRTASVVAKDHVHVLRLDRRDLFRLMDRYPQIAIEICRVLSRRLRALNERLQS